MRWWGSGRSTASMLREMAFGMLIRRLPSHSPNHHFRCWAQGEGTDHRWLVCPLPQGKDFAKSMTWWDVMFAGFGGRGSRDESALVLLLQWVLRIAMNFTIGFIYSLVSFLIGLFWIIADFSPNPASAMGFYLCFFVAAVRALSTPPTAKVDFLPGSG